MAYKMSLKYFWHLKRAPDNIEKKTKFGQNVDANQTSSNGHFLFQDSLLKLLQNRFRFLNLIKSLESSNWMHSLQSMATLHCPYSDQCSLNTLLFQKRSAQFLFSQKS